MEHLNAQHCVTIALAFIAIIAACATLINITNSKADSMANRFRELTKECRDDCANSRRLQLQRQIILFRSRTKNVTLAQCCLFFTIGIFIFSIAIFIALGLYLIYFNVPADIASLDARKPIILVGGCVMVGTVCMCAAIVLQYLELGKAYKTFEIEISDCLPPGDAPATLV